MRRVFTVAIGTALCVAMTASAWADASQLRLPNGADGGQQIGQSRGMPRVYPQSGGGAQPRFGGRQGGGPFAAPRPHYGGGAGQRFGDDRDFGGRRERRHDGYGAALGAGVAGVAAGALIGGALSDRRGYDGYGYEDGTYGDVDPIYAAPSYGQPYQEGAEIDPEDNPAACAQRYRSYDPESGTYLGYDGERHPCP